MGTSARHSVVGSLWRSGFKNEHKGTSHPLHNCHSLCCPSSRPRPRGRPPRSLLPVVPVAHPKCSAVDEVKTRHVCKPTVERKCTDVVFKRTVLEKIETTCKDVTTKSCSDGTHEVTEGEPKVVKREAEPEPEADPALLPYGLPYAHHYPLVTIKHHCVTATHKSCKNEPILKEEETTVPHCNLVRSHECDEVEYTVKKKVC